MSKNTGSEKSPRLTPDIGTLLGFIIATACIGAGLLIEGGKIADIQQATAAIIVFGGTLGAVLVTNPFEVFLAAMKRGLAVILSPPDQFGPTLDRMARLAETARRMGLTSLEAEAEDIEDLFFRKALGSAADGTEPRLIREMMENDADLELGRAEEEIKVWESAGGYAPTIGIIGAVLGLIQVMKHLENLDEVGRGIAVAFVATVYGVFSANVIFLPIAGKLRSHSRRHDLLREMMIEGVVSIAEGINPRLLRVKFDALIPAKPRSRPSRAKLPSSPLAAPGSLASEAYE